jgi:hypothetical protein
VNLWYFKLLGNAFVLGMLLESFVNMHVMTQKFVLAFERSISKVQKLPCKNNNMDYKFKKGCNEWKIACVDARCGIQI